MGPMEEGSVNYMAIEKAAAAQILGGLRESPTLSQNIDMRISNLENQIQRLKKVRQLLSEPTGILNVPIDDLRFAMNY